MDTAELTPTMVVFLAELCRVRKHATGACLYEPKFGKEWKLGERREKAE